MECHSSGIQISGVMYLATAEATRSSLLEPQSLRGGLMKALTSEDWMMSLIFGLISVLDKPVSPLPRVMFFLPVFSVVYLLVR